MERRSWTTAAGFLLTVAVYAGLSRVWTDTDSEWYRDLDKPWVMASMSDLGSGVAPVERLTLLGTGAVARGLGENCE